MVKNIAIMDCVYEELVKRKRPDESFSEELTRIIGKKKSILEFAGVWKLSGEEYERRISLAKKMRSDADRHAMERLGRDDRP